MSTYVVTACSSQSYLQIQLDYKDIQIFLAAAIFKSRHLKMATTVMTVEFGTIQDHSSLEDIFEACLCISLNRYKQINDHCVNYDILI